ncbi:substrate-binding domain-containing protein [Kribbella solani]|uniref:sugar ABC transporter substrate-binding protein n=1 Tax=Kribbella solani TaxID=236067 RepID=UPI0029A17CFB|nr:substrate-binding domain-containing protein [Kribbella solani]MDX3006406.1 substrate-binding domain-containing protein [Kribbella solani]
MRTSTRAVALTGTTLALMAGLVACGNSNNSSSSSGSSSAPPANTKVGILLPDTASSPRWVSADPNELRKQCTDNKLTCYIDNANGGATTMQSQAQALINQGVGVLLVTNLDSGSGKAIESLAKQHNVVTIDYDRLTTGGSAAYYVSYDNVKVGEDQGKALTSCPQVTGKSAVGYVDIDGAPTDNNATLFAQGYNSVLSKQTGWTKLAEQTGNWDPATAQTVFTTMLGQHPNLGAVMVANDTMAQSVINVLKSQSLSGKVAVSGQDATAGGLDNVMEGTQCFTIYKPVAGEADVAVKLAGQILSGQKPTAPATIKDPTTGREVPSYLASPTVITKANVAQPVKDGYETAASVCPTPALQKLCTENGIHTP